MLKFPSSKGRRNYVFSKRGTTDNKEDIKKWSLQKQNTRNIEKVFGQKIFMEEMCKFTWKQYMLFLFAYKCSFGHLNKYSALINYYGPSTFLIVYTISYSVLVTPMIMLYLFLGRYSKRTCIKVWDILPLFKGIGYSIVLLLCVRTIPFYVSGSVTMFYVFESFRDPLPWTNCNFTKASANCVDSTTVHKINVSTTECCIRSIVPTYSRCNKTDTGSPLNYAARDYFRYYLLLNYTGNHVMELIKRDITVYSWSDLGSINIKLLPFLFLAWLITYVWMILGFRRFKFLIAKLIIFIYTLCMSKSIIAFLVGRISGKKNEGVMFISGGIFNFEAIMSMVTTLIIDAVPDVVILIGAYGPRTLPVNLDVLIFSVINFAFILLQYLSSVTIHNSIMRDYPVVPLSCLIGSGLEIYLSVIPELLSRMSAPNLSLIFHFLCMSTMAVTTGAIIALGIIDLIMEAFPVLLPHRIHCCLIICVFCFIINLPFLTKAMGVMSSLVYVYVEMFSSLIIAIPTVVAIMWIYGVERIKRDYEFVHGHPPGAYWVVCWKYIPFCYIFILIHNVVFGIADINKKKMRPEIFHTCFFLTTVICSPIVIFAFGIYIVHIKNRTVKKMFRSSETWGDPDPKIRQDRLNFNPLKEIRYKRDGQTTCTHNCLLNSKYLKEEIEYVEKITKASKELKIIDTEKS